MANKRGREDGTTEDWDAWSVDREGGEEEEGGGRADYDRAGTPSSRERAREGVGGRCCKLFS